MDNLYREIILDHYKNPRNKGHLDHPSCSASKRNPLCGDEIEVSLLVADDIVLEAKFSGSGCAISTAAASMLTSKLIGMKTADIEKMTHQDINALLGTELSPNRVKCALLALETTKKAISN